MIFIFLVGCCIGSFVNVLIYRIPKKIDFIFGRSFCPQCFRIIKAYDLIPILSWFVLKGRCRYCKKKISFKYPLIELLSGMLALFCLQVNNYQIIGLVNYAIIMILLTIAMIDFKEMIIPDGLIITLFILILIKMSFSSCYLIEHILGMFCISSIMYLMNFIIKDCFGGGDIKLMMAAGFLLGIKSTILAFLIAVLIGGLYAGYLLLSKKNINNKYMPFGPFLCIGIFLAMFYGQKIIFYYQQIMD